MRLRVIAGALGGRFFDSPGSSSTHPMSDRIRGALFNILGDISGLTVLDAFSGSGAIAFEAVSRGAKSAVSIEKNRQAADTISKNINALGLGENVKLIRAGIASWAETYTGEPFDIVICDPPYHDLQLSSISRIISHLKQNGLMVISYPGRESAPTVNGVVVVDKRLYGDAALAIYRKGAA